MKLYTFMCCLTVVYGAPANDQDAQILKYEFETDTNGYLYKLNFETSDGTKRVEEASLRNAEDPENSILVVTGEYEYIGPDGITYKVTYTADENGFHPQGSHIPALPEQQPEEEDGIKLRFQPAVVASLLG